MQSNGGLIPARRGGELAVRTLLSGPAADTVAAAAFGEAAGLPDVISCDMGGTSFDVALIPGGRPAVTAEGSAILRAAWSHIFDNVRCGAVAHSLR